jgi:cation transport ATPase
VFDKTGTLTLGKPVLQNRQHYSEAHLQVAASLAAQAQGTALANAGMLQGQGITGAGQAISGGLGNLGQYNMFQQGLAAGHNPFTANNANRYFG